MALRAFRGATRLTADDTGEIRTPDASGKATDTFKITATAASTGNSYTLTQADIPTLLSATTGVDTYAVAAYGSYASAAGPFVDADLSSIENRVSAWMAGQNDKLELFRQGLDEYKTFGTSIRINAAPGDGPRFSAKEFGQMHKDAIAALQPPSDSRILLQELAPLPTVLRQQGWTSPQGFDPFVSRQYRDLGAKYGQWDNDRGLALDPMNPELMRVFGLRYVITAKQGSKFEAMNTSPRFRMVGQDKQYYQVFEYLDAQSVYGFPGKVEVTGRDPEHRVLQVDSPNGGLLTFAEQAYPGWSAKVDDKYYPLEPWETAFQAVRIDSGKHTVELVYEERYLRLGAQISIASLLILAVWVVLSSGSTDSRANRVA